MLIAVTKVDDVTQTEWEKCRSSNPRPKKREIFEQLVEEFKPRMKAQISEQLGKIAESSNEAVNAARAQARSSILQSLEIHPISAPEFKKILRDDEEDRPFLNDIEQTGIPQLERKLYALAETERGTRNALIGQLAERLATASRGEIQLIESSWQQETRADDDPIQSTVDLLVEKHENRIRRSDAQRRRGVLLEVQTVISTFPYKR